MRSDPFPPRVRRSLAYKDAGNVTSGASNLQAGTPRVYQLNSLFQPISGGHQPYGFDTMATLYRRYRVNSVTIKVETLPIVTGSIYQVIGVFPPGATQSTTNLLDAHEWGENPNGSTQIIFLQGTKQVVWQKRFEMHTLCGLTREEYANNVEDYSALVTANPARMPTLEVNISGFGASMQGYNIISLTFEAEFFERVSLNQS